MTMPTIRSTGLSGSITSAALRSRTDIRRLDIAKDAKFELDRCLSDADFAAWARKWGEAFVTYRLDPMAFQ